MKVAALTFLMLFAGVARGAEAAVDYSFDSDVRALSEVKVFAFGFVWMSGRSSGEVALARILKREDKIRPLIEVYNRGTPEARAYALAAFHYLAPPLFAQCQKDLVGRHNPKVISVRGCFRIEGSLLELIIRIHQGHFENEIKKYTKG